MKKNKMKYLEFPTRKQINFLEENGNYYSENKNAKKHFKTLLEEYGYYCPYCGSDISKGSTIGIKGNFEREHTIEKNQAGYEYKHLVHCKYNLCIACSKCNKNKKVNIISIEEKHLKVGYFNEICKNKNCTIKCELYSESLNDYIFKNNFIVQPYGVNNSKTGKEYKIFYNIKTRIFLPSVEENYSEEEKKFIDAHIKKLKLNIGLNKPVALKKEVERLKWIFDKRNTKIDESYFTEIKNNFDNILDSLFLKYFVTLDYESQYFLIAELYFEYQK